MEIERARYLNKTISFMWNGQVKVITGIRRCGKSYLLHILFKNYLLDQGVREDHILSIELDLTRDIRFRNPLELAGYVRELAVNKAEQFYLFVDEIQMSEEVPNPYNADGKKITFFVHSMISNHYLIWISISLAVTQKCSPQKFLPSLEVAAMRSGCIPSAFLSITPLLVETETMPSTHTHSLEECP